MSVPPRRPRRAPRPNARVRAALLGDGHQLAVLHGLSLGRALEEGPSPGGTQTRVRTLQPQPLPPAARTVTVTETGG